MKKEDLKAALTEAGVEFDDAASMEVLEGLLISAAKNNAGAAGEGDSELKGKLEAAEARIAQLEAQKGSAESLTADDAQLVKAKIAAGLSKDQAIEVVKRQKAHDKKLAAKKAA